MMMVGWLIIFVYFSANCQRLDLIKGDVDPTAEEAAWTAPNDPKKKEGETSATETSEESSQLAVRVVFINYLTKILQY